MRVLGALQLILLETLAFAFIVGVITSLTTPLVLARTAGLSPRVRHRALLLFGLSPVVFALAAVSATLAPSVLGLIWAEYDHCLVHAGTHVHLCLVHLPERLGNAGSWFVLSGATGLLGVRCSRGIAELWRASRLSARLLAHGSYEPRLAVHVVPTPQPLSFLIGLIRPTTVVSEGLLRSVTTEQLRAVILHERAHANRGDTFLRLLARTTTIFMWPSVRVRLLEELALAAEQSCDEDAASAIGDRLTMAETILKVERLLHAMPRELSGLAVAFGGTAVPRRVSALLEPPRSERGTRLPAILLLAALAALFAASEPLHHLTETLLGAVVH